VQRLFGTMLVLNVNICVYTDVFFNSGIHKHESDDDFNFFEVIIVYDKEIVGLVFDYLIFSMDCIASIVCGAFLNPLT